MLTSLILIFVLAYAAIALEHPLRINKAASALICAGLLWTIYAASLGDAHLLGEQLGESLMTTAQIVFFLMGAMAIVEVVDAHDGFEVITSRIRTQKLSTLMWLVGFVTFFLSALLDNLTTTIVMVSLMRKLLDKHEDRLLFAGIIVIAANSGGAWSPMGDVTTRAGSVPPPPATRRASTPAKKASSRACRWPPSPSALSIRRSWSRPMSLTAILAARANA